MPSVAYLAWLALAATSRKVLLDLSPTEPLRGWHSAGSGAYSIPVSKHTHVDNFHDALLRAAPTSYWPLGEPSGTRVSEQSATTPNLPATYSGSPTLDQAGALAENARAVSFDGVDDKIAYTGLAASTSTFDLLFLFKPDSSQPDALGPIFTDTSGVGLFYKKATRTLTFRFSATDHENTTALTDGTWYLCRLKVVAGAARFSLNGVSDGTFGSCPSFTPTRTGDDGTQQLKGTLQQLAYWVGANLTDEQERDLQNRRAFYPTPISLYRQITSAFENGAALTSQANLAAVQANAGSFFYDESAEVLYVKTSGGVNPDTVALLEVGFTLRLATEPTNFSDQPPYAAMINGDSLPSYRQEQREPLAGLIAFPSGDCALVNADGFWDPLVTRWNWTNRTATFRIGGGDLAFSDYEVAAAMELARPISAKNDVAILQLRSRSNATDRAFPLHTWTDARALYGAVDADREGQYLPMFWGTVYDMPCLRTMGSAGFDRYVFADPFTSVSPTYLEVRAIEIATGAVTVLVAGVDYAPDIGTPAFQVLAGTWPFASYEFRVDATRTPSTVGAIAKNILELCDVPAASIDAAAFTQADLDNPAALGVYIAGGSGPETLQTANDLHNVLERSTLASVFQTAAGIYTCKIWDPSSDFLNLDRLTEADVFSFEPVDNVTAPVAATVRVRYAAKIGSGAWAQESSGSTAAAAAIGADETLTIDTGLVDQARAAQLAQRLARLAAVATEEIEIAAGPTLMTAAPQGKVRVQRTRGPGFAAALDIVLEAESIEKRLADLTVRATLGNQRGLGEATKRAAPIGAPSWDAATDDERRAYAFAADPTTERVDVGDPSTYHQSLAW